VLAVDFGMTKAAVARRFVDGLSTVTRNHSVPTLPIAALARRTLHRKFHGFWNWSWVPIS
jgi:hypothetical protein